MIELMFGCVLILGLALGSFVNALVWRVHEQAKHGKKKADPGLSILHGRSMCPDCRHQLGFWDLLPVVSWLTLAGKCRYCRKPISWQYPLVELSTAVLFGFSYLFWPYGWQVIGVFQFAIWLLMLTGFMALSVYDLRWQILPTRIIYPLTGLAALQTLVLTVYAMDVQVVVGALLGVLCLGGLFYAMFQVSDGKWIGGGDVRLGVTLGLLVGGPAQAILLLFLASLTGTIVSLPLLASNKSRLRRKVAFGPFLIVAAVVVYLFGTSIVSWYKNRFLLL
jgi:prepilin signal peptidase PulO-like enzyme (type II secretory pathway)